MRRPSSPFVAAAALAWCVAAAIGAHGQDRSLEIRLKAAIVSKIPQFIQWPPVALSGRTTIDLCIVGGDPFGADLQALLAGATVSQRPVVVRRVELDPTGCHLLLLSASAVTSHPTVLQRASALPVLTVSDDARFLDRGGIVRLRVVDGRMRFDVNLAVAQRVGLQISSQFLQLAASVRGARP